VLDNADALQYARHTVWHTEHINLSAALSMLGSVASSIWIVAVTRDHIAAVVLPAMLMLCLKLCVLRTAL
jgi:hypothetical protein